MKTILRSKALRLSFAALTATLFGFGCTDKPTAEQAKGEENDSAKSDASSTAEVGEKTLTLYSWDEYFSEESFAGFEELTGAKVIYETFNDAEEMIENLRSYPGKYDVVVIDGPYISMLKDARLLKELDHSRLSNFSNIDKPYTERVFDPGNRFSIPYMWGTTLLAYRNDKIENPPESWSLLFDPAYAGKVSILQERNDCLPTTLLSLGLDPNSKNEEDYAKAETKMIDLVTKNRARFGTDNEMKEHLLSGDSWVALMYSGDAALIADPETNEDENISFFIPQEGACLWVDNFAVAKDSQKPELAEKFLNYMMEAEVAAELSNFLWYATANEKAGPFLDAELRDDKTIYPDKEVQARCTVISQGPTQERLMNLSWRNVEKAVDDRVEVVGAK
ncbi:MAG: spermidine/putrescine-binding protein [Verrucomicrobiales bacterium]|jgi:spermidine/putrescine-binding protein